MSRANVELARRAIGNLQALVDLFSEDVVWDNLHFGGAVPLDHEARVSGKVAVTRMIRSWVSTWEGFRFEAEDIIDAGDSVVLAVRETARGRASGVPMENRYFQVWTFSDGRIVSGASYERKRDALTAVGVVE